MEDSALLTKDDIRKAELYYRKGNDPANRAIRKFLRDTDMIVHGGQAINAYLPDWLERETKDWDIFTPENAEERAAVLEKKLDHHYGGDFFGVETAKHPGTFRVRNKITGEVIADITILDRKVDAENIRGINYATLEYHEEHIRNTIDDPAVAFRRKKDLDTLQRITIYKEGKKRRTPTGIRKRTARNSQRTVDDIMNIGLVKSNY